MLAMFVTLDVSRVSGWLNAILVFVVQLCAKPCRVKSGSYSARCGPGGGEGVGPARAEEGLRARARRGAHRKHPRHRRDPGCVETQRLIERRRALCRVGRA